MAFTDYKNLTILKAKHPQIIVKSEDFIPKLEELEIEEALQKDVKKTYAPTVVTNFMPVKRLYHLYYVMFGKICIGKI